MFEPLPETVQTEPKPERRFLSGSRIAMAAAVLALGALISYAVHEHSLASTAAERNAAITASLNSTNAQIAQLTAKLNDLSTPKPQAAEVQTPSKSGPVSKAKSSPNARHRQSSRREVRDDPRWKKVQSQLDEQGRAITSTRQDLLGTRTELQGSIARTHDELVVLQRKGERRYYEFNIQKTKQFSRAGSMSVKLRKSDVKHQFADLDLLVDDRVVTKKHLNLYEPTMFVIGDGEQPAQLVINNISKNHIRGYVSEPKYGKAELSAAQPQSPAKGAEHDVTTENSPGLHQRATLANQ